MNASGKMPPNGNGWMEREDTQTRIKLHTALDEGAAAWRRRTIGIVGSVSAAIVALGGVASVVAFGFGRAASTDVQALDVRVVKVEKDVESHGSELHEVKSVVKEMAAEQAKSAYRIERRVDAVLDQLQPVARRTGAAVVPRPPRAVLKPTESVTVERMP